MNFQDILNLDGIISWLLTSGLKIFGILLVALIASRLLKNLVPKVLRTFVQKGLNGLQVKSIEVQLTEERWQTIEKVIVSISRTAVWLIAVITLLPELGVNIGPILTGLGIGGLALGLGARSTIQDYLSGFFILIEDHYRVGEQIEAAGLKGKVKSLTLRRTVLEDSEGTLHYIPNNQINKSSNFSRK